MPTELVRRVNLDLLYPPFVERYLEVLAACKDKGALYYAVSGLRSMEEQQALYDQGRTKPGPVVTHAKPGSSAHNYGIAIDSTRDKDAARQGLQPDWNLESYRVLAEEAQKRNLEAGFYYSKIKDGPHVQLPLSRHGITLSTLLRIHKTSGSKGVFKYLDQFQW